MEQPFPMLGVCVAWDRRSLRLRQVQSLCRPGRVGVGRMGFWALIMHFGTTGWELEFRRTPLERNGFCSSRGDFPHFPCLHCYHQ